MMANIAPSTTLSDDQIDQLLKEAEVRLQAKQQSQNDKAVVAVPSKSDIVKVSKPEVSAPKATTSTSTKDNAKSEELSIRVPESRRSKKEMVRGTYFLRDPSYQRHPLMMKLISQFN